MSIGAATAITPSTTNLTGFTTSSSTASTTLLPPPPLQPIQPNDLTSALAATASTFHQNPYHHYPPAAVAAAFCDPSLTATTPYCWQPQPNGIYMNGYGMPQLDETLSYHQVQQQIQPSTTTSTSIGGATTNGIVELGKLPPYENLEPLGAYGQAWSTYSYDDKMLDPTAQYMCAAGIDKNFYNQQFTVSFCRFLWKLKALL